MKTVGGVLCQTLEHLNYKKKMLSIRPMLLLAIALNWDLLPRLVEGQQLSSLDCYDTKSTLRTLSLL